MQGRTVTPSESRRILNWKKPGEGDTHMLGEVVALAV